MSSWPVLLLLLWTSEAVSQSDKENCSVETNPSDVPCQEDETTNFISEKNQADDNAGINALEGDHLELETEYLCQEATRTIVHWRSSKVPIFGIDKYNRFLVNVYRVNPEQPLNLTKTAEMYSDPGLHYVKILDLKPNSTYTFGIKLKTTTNSMPIEVFTKKTFQTLAEDRKLSPVAKTTISNFVSYGGEEVRTNFTWTPIPEYVCSYEILIVNHSCGSIQSPQHLFSRAQDLYTMELPNLQYGCTISVAVWPATEKREGNRTWLKFQVPECGEIHSWDYNICDPLPPQNVRITVKDCVLDVRWDKYKHPPPKISIIAIPNSPTRLNFTINETISGEFHEFRASTRNIGEYMTVFIVAHSHHTDGRYHLDGIANHCTPEEAAEPYGPPHVTYYPAVVAPPSQHQSPQSTSVYLILITISLIVIALLLAVIAGYKIYNDLKPGAAETQRDSYEMREPLAENMDNEEEQTAGSEDAGEFEVKRQSLQLKEIVGEGAFGVVKRAYWVHGNEKKEVAVKMLRDDASAEDKKQLRLELEVMKSVGSHNNIVCLVGFCSSNSMLVVEYCSLGDLQNYLRDIWRTKNWAKAVYKKNNPAHSEESENVVSNLIYSKSEVEKKQLNVTIFDLISLARQVALGMNYLSSNKVVHRDLAARNILLNSAFTAKISDFGLSRDVYEENMYRHKGVRRLPVKWMALECLAHQLFTTQSDVWSFGILLWEIMTLGGCPYHSLQSAQVYKSLQQGERLERPSLCPKDLYDLMYECWNAIPHKRPTFSQLVNRIERMMQSEEKHRYLELDEVMANYSHLYELFEEPDAVRKNETNLGP